MNAKNTHIKTDSDKTAHTELYTCRQEETTYCGNKEEICKPTLVQYNMLYKINTELICINSTNLCAVWCDWIVSDIWVPCLLNILLTESIVLLVYMHAKELRTPWLRCLCYYTVCGTEHE